MRSYLSLTRPPGSYVGQVRRTYTIATTSHVPIKVPFLKIQKKANSACARMHEATASVVILSLCQNFWWIFQKEKIHGRRERVITQHMGGNVPVLH